MVPVDVPPVTNRSAIEPGMEISFAHQYGKPAAGNVDGDTGVAFLSGELRMLNCEYERVLINEVSFYVPGLSSLIGLSLRRTLLHSVRYSALSVAA